MTELLYQTDSYLQEFEANILTIQKEERAILLDRTAFYPGGGGQSCDFGSINVGDVIYQIIILSSRARWYTFLNVLLSKGE
jgi:misacylated tRNA(Ala) deacylase